MIPARSAPIVHRDSRTENRTKESNRNHASDTHACRRAIFRAEAIVTTTPRLWKDETQVNLIDAGNPPLGNNFQGNAEIAAQPNGGYLVVWSDGAHVYKNGFAIVARTYDSAGDFTRGDFLVSDDPNSDDTSPAVAVLSNGDIAVAYEHNYFENRIQQEDLEVKVYDSGLHLIRTDFIQNEAFAPSLTARAGGGYVVSYTESGGGRSGVEAQIVSPPDFEPRVNVNPFGLSNAPADEQHSVSDAQLATLSNGWFVGAFKVEDTTTSHTDIGYSIFTNTGAQVVYDARVPFEGIANTEPDVTALRDGGFVIAWSLEDSNGLGHVFAEVLTNTGAFVNAFFVSTKSTAQIDHFLPNVVGLDDGGFLVSWQEDMAGGFDVTRGQRFDAIGHKIGDQFFVSVATHPEAAVLDDGRIAYAVDTVAPGTPPNEDVATSIFTTQLADGHVHDFNDDGTSDILLRNDNGAVALWELKGGQVVAGTSLERASPDWHIAATGDFNGDAMSDILWRDDNGAVGIWELNRGQVVSHVNVGTAGPDWHIAVTGDFNGDNESDILWHNDNGAVGVWEIDQGQVVAGGSVGDPGPGWHIADTGDFNGDGKSDILMQDDNGLPLIWTMDGTSITGGAFLPNIGSDWHVAKAADFNGDGKSDILLQTDNGASLIWTMDGTTITGGAFLPNIGPGWHVADAADFNGDGKADIRWHHDSGLSLIWTMDGTSVTGGAFLPNVSGDWHLF
jgi:hypothetical protein